MDELWEFLKKKPYRLWFAGDVILLLCYLLFLRDLKWKLLLLTPCMLFLVYIISEWLKDIGMEKGAAVVKKAHTVLSIVVAIVLGITLLGSLFGIWEL